MKNELKVKFEEILKEPEFFSLNGLLKSDTMLAMELAYRLDRKAHEWVSVETALPTHGEDYNVVLDLNDNMGPPVSGIMEFDGINKVWNYPGSDVICDCVTHWMYLPNPPIK